MYISRRRLINIRHCISERSLHSCALLIETVLLVQMICVSYSLRLFCTVLHGSGGRDFHVRGFQNLLLSADLCMGWRPSGQDLKWTESNRAGPGQAESLIRISQFKISKFQILRGCISATIDQWLSDWFHMIYRVPTPPGKSGIFFLKIPGPGKWWKITFVLESPGN